MKRNLLVIAIVLVLAGIAVYRNSPVSGREAVVPTQTAPKTGFLAPAISLDALDGKTYNVGGPREKPLLLNFWASWCGPCEMEAPDLHNMYDKYKDKLDIYGVNVTKNDILNDAKDLVKQYKLIFPILLDKEGTAADMYQVQVLPTSYLIDKNGAIVDVIHLLEPRELERKLKSLINR